MAARWAISRRRSGDSLLARAVPPRFPPSLPSATAAGFFCLGSGVGLSAASPVAISTISFASWFASLGRLLERLGISHRRPIRFALSTWNFREIARFGSAIGIRQPMPRKFQTEAVPTIMLNGRVRIATLHRAEPVRADIEMDVVVMLAIAVGGQHDREITAGPARQTTQKQPLRPALAPIVFDADRGAV